MAQLLLINKVVVDGVARAADGALYSLWAAGTCRFAFEIRAGYQLTALVISTYSMGHDSPSLVRLQNAYRDPCH
jgi:hypothetical protein